MNICFFNRPEVHDLAARTGVNRSTFLIATELRRRGHSVEFYFRPPQHRVRIPFVSSVLELFNRSEGKRFREFLKEHKVDVAVWQGVAWHLLLPVNNLPCKLITVLRSVPFFNEQACANNVVKRLKLRSRLAQWIVRSKPCRFLICKWFRFSRSRLFYHALRHSEKFVLFSEELFADFTPGEKFPQKVCAIPNIAPFGAQNVDFLSKKKELLWVGRMDFAHKRPDLMVQVWQRLQDRFPDWSLRLVGDGPYLPELKALAKELGVQRVFFEGYQDPAPYYRSAPIFCFTSAYEGFGLVLVEAQAYGCVPIAFDVLGSLRDIIDNGVNGYLVSPFDLDAYAEKLSGLMSNSELRQRLARNGQESIAKFSPEAVGDKWEKLLRDVQTDGACLTR